MVKAAFACASLTVLSDGLAKFLSDIPTVPDAGGAAIANQREALLVQVLVQTTAKENQSKH
jgi:hypothetical protein